MGRCPAMFINDKSRNAHNKHIHTNTQTLLERLMLQLGTKHTKDFTQLLHIHAHIHTHMHTYMHTHACTHTHTHTCTHTHTRNRTTGHPPSLTTKKSSIFQLHYASRIKHTHSKKSVACTWTLS